MFNPFYCFCIMRFLQRVLWHSPVEIHRHFGRTYRMLLSGFFLGLLFNSDDEGNTIPRKVGGLLLYY
jgi:hypothetical protein